jgi:hypothetical protein
MRMSRIVAALRPARTSLCAAAPTFRLALVLCASAILGASVAIAGDALPVHFSVGVDDWAHDTHRRYDWKADALVPTDLTGWACRMGAVSTESGEKGASTVGSPSASSYAFVGQTGEITCQSSAGSVTVSVPCVLTSEHDFKMSDVTIRDNLGRSVTVGAICTNYEAKFLPPISAPRAPPAGGK